MIKKIQILGLLGLFAYGLSAQAADQSLDEFKTELTNLTSSLGEAMVECFNDDTTYAVRFIRSLQDTDLYKTCTDPWFWTRKETQIGACMDLAKKMQNDMPKNRHSERWSAEVTSRWESFETFNKRLELKERLGLSENIRTSLVTQYNAYNTEGKAVGDRLNAGHQSACGSLSMAESFKCMFRRVLKYLEVTHPQMMSEYGSKMSVDVESAKSKINQFDK